MLQDLSNISLSPGRVLKSFFEALTQRDLESLMQLWADDEEIVCVHPNGVRQVGYEAVYASWVQFFNNAKQLSFEARHVIAHETVGMVAYSLLVIIDSRAENRTGVFVATCVCLRTPVGWRLIAYHISPSGGSDQNESWQPTEVFH